MILPGWQDPSGFAKSAGQYVAFVQLCCREIPHLHISFVASARISVMLVQPSAKNTNIAKLCGNAPRRAFAVRRRAGKLPNLVPFEKLARRRQVVERFSEPIAKPNLRKRRGRRRSCADPPGRGSASYTSVLQVYPSLTAPFIFRNLKSGEGADQIASFVIEKGRISKVGCVAVCVTFLSWIAQTEFLCRFPLARLIRASKL